MMNLDVLNVMEDIYSKTINVIYIFQAVINTIILAVFNVIMITNYKILIVM